MAVCLQQEFICYFQYLLFAIIYYFFIIYHLLLPVIYYYLFFTLQMMDEAGPEHLADTMGPENTAKLMMEILGKGE